MSSISETTGKPLVISDQKILTFLFGVRKSAVLLDAITETLSEKGLNSLTDAKIEDVLCTSSLCASE